MTEETTAILDRIGKMQRSLAEMKSSLLEKWTLETVPSGKFKVFVCRSRGERYGLFVDTVEEVLPMCELTSYPQGPPWLSGLLNLRGRMVPVVDVHARIERCGRPIDINDFIVVVNINTKRFGLVFQEVFHIHKIDGAELQSPVQDIPEAPYVLGIVETERTPVFLLSLSCILGTSEVPEELF